MISRQLQEETLESSQFDQPLWNAVSALEVFLNTYKHYYIETYFIFSIFLAISRPMSIYAISIWSIVHFHLHFHYDWSYNLKMKWNEWMKNIYITTMDVLKYVYIPYWTNTLCFSPDIAWKIKVVGCFEGF